MRYRYKILQNCFLKNLKQVYRQTETKADLQTDSQIDRQTDRQRDGQTGRMQKKCRSVLAGQTICPQAKSMDEEGWMNAQSD